MDNSPKTGSTRPMSEVQESLVRLVETINENNKLATKVRESVEDVLHPISQTDEKMLNEGTATSPSSSNLSVAIENAISELRKSNRVLQNTLDRVAI